MTLVMPSAEPSSAKLRLASAIDRNRDHIRGLPSEGAVVVVAYLDFLCPYCRKLGQVFRRLREALGDRLAYVVRHFPNERAHPGAELVARAAEAAGRQDHFWEMYDRIFDEEPPLGDPELVDLAREIDLDVDRFRRDLQDEQVRARVERDSADGRNHGVTGTPTLFIDGHRYDGAWDFHSLLEALERPVAARVYRSARAFASLPTSAGLVLLLSAGLGLICANTAMAPIYERVMNTYVGVGPLGGLLSLTVRDWFSEGLLTVFFLLVGLEIRREMTRGALIDWHAAILPIVAAIGGVVTPALIYLAINRGPASQGWAIPTATDVAFTLGLLAVLGDRIPTLIRVFVAALAVVDDILSVLTLAIFYPRALTPSYAIAVLVCMLVLVAFNRMRVYASWPYVLASLALWVSLHALGVHAALAGVLLAMCIPTLPAPMASPLLAQAATALAELEHAEREARRRGDDDVRLEGEPVWEWAARNLSAASARLLSPAERIERALAPWSAYVILPAFAFSATGLAISLDFSSVDAGRIFLGITLGLVIGKPVGILFACGLAIASRLAVVAEGVLWQHLVGAACLCGVGDTMALLLADRALALPDAAIAKLAVLVGSATAAAVGIIVLRYCAGRLLRAPR
jgi:NhaA family Na+:H+ antiporter